MGSLACTNCSTGTWTGIGGVRLGVVVANIQVTDFSVLHHTCMEDSVDFDVNAHIMAA